MNRLVRRTTSRNRTTDRLVDSRAAGQFERWLTLAASVAAPVTLLSALLFYFGYVSSRAQYLYFGVDVDTVGLTTQAYIMRSPQALLVPFLVLTLGAAALLLVPLAVRRRTVPLPVVRTVLAMAAVLLVTGLVLVFGYSVFGGWPFYGLMTPLLLATGVGLTFYVGRLHGAPSLVAAAHRGRGTVRPSALVRSAALALVLIVIATCLFWTTATVAGTARSRRRIHHSTA
jgi:hypothetical protein